jgi:signal transduction histidine kinase
MDREILRSPPRQLQLVIDVVQPVGAGIADDGARQIAELEAQVAIRDAFISTVSHELRNPMTPLVFRTRMLLEKFSKAGPESPVAPDWMLAQLKSVDAQLQRVVRTLDRLQQVSHLSQGRFDLRLEPVDLTAEMGDAIRSVEEDLAVARCDVVVHDGRPVVGTWDRTGIEQICRNLLSNAMRFGAGGRIDISITCEGPFAVLEVRDHGIGISREQQGHIFERLDRTDGSRCGGLGVGLWIVRTICTALGGRVHVESELGAGATFSVILPLGREADGDGAAFHG